VEWIGDEVRPVYPCSGGLPWGGGVEEEKSSSERCEVERCSGAAFIGGEGRGGGAGKAVGARALRRPPLRPVARCVAVTGGRGRGRGWAAPG
jgi:hypothetical protein